MVATFVTTHAVTVRLQKVHFWTFNECSFRLTCSAFLGLRETTGEIRAMGNLIGTNKDHDDIEDTLEDKWHKVDIGDHNAIKNLLDDTVIKVFEEQQYNLDRKYDNLKLFFMFIACCIAGFSHFQPTPFPENFKILAACVIGFFAINSGLWLAGIVYEKETILRVYSKQKKNNKKIFVDTSLERFDTAYKLSLSQLEKTKKTSKDLSLPRYFDSDGRFDEECFKKSVLEVIDLFEKTKHE